MSGMSGRHAPGTDDDTANLESGVASAAPGARLPGGSPACAA